MELKKIFKEVEKMKPVWVNFIIELGYTQEQGERFAEGYKSELSKLPTIEKLRALSDQHDKCMKTGFIFAGIDEDEAFDRANAT